MAKDDKKKKVKSRASTKYATSSDEDSSSDDEDNLLALFANLNMQQKEKLNELIGAIHDALSFNDASPLVAELQATPWPLSYKPPQLPMYDGYSDPKQILMSYEVTISSYGGNTVVMAKSFVMAVQNVAQTWYSSLRPGTITSWQKLKDMLVTSFQGFQMKPVIAQALFQCTQDHEEYLQAYV
jgi:hypothetical protein